MESDITSEVLQNIVDHFENKHFKKGWDIRKEILEREIPSTKDDNPNPGDITKKDIKQKKTELEYMKKVEEEIKRAKDIFE